MQYDKRADKLATGQVQSVYDLSFVDLDSPGRVRCRCTKRSLPRKLQSRGLYRTVSDYL